MYFAGQLHRGLILHGQRWRSGRKPSSLRQSSQLLHTKAWRHVSSRDNAPDTQLPRPGSMGSVALSMLRMVRLGAWGACQDLELYCRVHGAALRALHDLPSTE
jgi:hypothetical protein